MSVFLGGKWKQLEDENQQLSQQLQDSLDNNEFLRTQLTQQKRQSDILVQEKNKAEFDARQAKETIEKRLVPELRYLKEQHILNLTTDLERKAMEAEDYAVENAWLRTKKDLGNTKLSVLKDQRDALARKLKVAEHKVLMGSEYKKEAQARIYSFETEKRAHESTLAKKEMLIRSLQREKTSMFQELTKLRAQTPANVEPLQKENAKLLRELRQMQVVQRPKSVEDVYGSRNSNPWSTAGGGGTGTSASKT
ncbi:unnamed protein product [Amoebophrya sp. A120]|nr:unnamed protein product [Amoebophrya sp. A120]|eukprot:GSA120T00016381001.1